MDVWGSLAQEGPYPGPSSKALETRTHPLGFVGRFLFAPCTHALKQCGHILSEGLSPDFGSTSGSNAPSSQGGERLQQGLVLRDVVGLKDSLHTAPGKLLAAELREAPPSRLGTWCRYRTAGLHVDAHGRETPRHALHHEETICSLLGRTHGRGRLSTRSQPGHGSGPRAPHHFAGHVDILRAGGLRTQTRAAVLLVQGGLSVVGDVGGGDLALGPLNHLVRLLSSSPRLRRATVCCISSSLACTPRVPRSRHHQSPEAPLPPQIPQQQSRRQRG